MTNPKSPFPYTSDSVPRWLPSWKNPSEYPVTGTGMPQFGWEFLRRNPEYQIIYNELSELYKIHADKLVPLGLTQELEGIWITALHRMAEFPDICSVICNLMAKWRLGGFIRDPSIPSSINTGLSIGAAGYGPFKHSDLMWYFDMSKPLEPQLKEVRNLVKDVLSRQGKIAGAESKYKLNKEKLSIYLRILDADAIGENDSLIASQLFPLKENFKYSLKAHGSPQRDHLKQSRKAAYKLMEDPYKLLY